MANISYAAIRERWDTRIVPNLWHTMGESGAKAYLKKYGRNISEEKIRAIADYARNQGYSDFADGMTGNRPVKKVPATPPVPAFVTLSEDEVSVPIAIAFQEAKDNGYSTFSLVEMPFKKLAEMSPVFVGWSPLASKAAFREITGFLTAGTRVRTFIGIMKSGLKNIVGIDIKVKGESEADAVCLLSKFENYHLKHYYVEPGWTYFSAEVE